MKANLNARFVAVGDVDYLSPHALIPWFMPRFDLYHAINYNLFAVDDIHIGISVLQWNERGRPIPIHKVIPFV